MLKLYVVNKKLSKCVDATKSKEVDILDFFNLKFCSFL